MAKGLGITQIVQLLPFALPTALMFAVPGTILFAMSSVYGRMSSSNEIVALKSLGVSPMAILWPSFALAVVLSFATVWLNDLAQAWSFHSVQKLVLDSVEDIAYDMLATNKTYSSSMLSVTVKEVKRRKLISPIFWLAGSKGEAPTTITAKTAELRSVPGSGKLTLGLYHFVIDGPGFHAEHPDEYMEREIVIDPKAGRVGQLPLAHGDPRHSAAIVEQKAMIERIQERMVGRGLYEMLSGDFDRLTSSSWNDEAKNLEFQRLQLYRMQTEPPRRWANGFSCLCFAIVGAGMAIRMRNADVLTSFALCFFPILLVYYPLLAFGLDRAKAGAITPYAVWLANLILVVWGVWLLHRVIRY